MGNNPFSDLNNARLEAEAREQKNVGLAQPFDALVVETLKQLKEAGGWKDASITRDHSPQWFLFIPFNQWFRAYKFVVSLETLHNGELCFWVSVEMRYSDNSGKHGELLRGPATKDNLVQMLMRAAVSEDGPMRR